MGRPGITYAPFQGGSTPHTPYICCSFFLSTTQYTLCAGLPCSSCRSPFCVHCVANQVDAGSSTHPTIIDVIKVSSLINLLYVGYVGQTYLNYNGYVAIEQMSIFLLSKAKLCLMRLITRSPRRDSSQTPSSRARGGVDQFPLPQQLWVRLPNNQPPSQAITTLQFNCPVRILRDQLFFFCYLFIS